MWTNQREERNVAAPETANKNLRTAGVPYTGFSRDVLLPGGWRKPAMQLIRYAPVAVRIFTAGLLKGARWAL